MDDTEGRPERGFTGHLIVLSHRGGGGGGGVNPRIFEKTNPEPNP
jgi:hypothetical protein